MPKNKNLTLKEIHRFLIKNNLLHSSDNFKINKKILNEALKKDNYEEISPALFEQCEIYPSEREI